MVAVVVALVGVLVLYYGVLAGPGAEEPNDGDIVTDDPTLASNDEESMEQSTPRTALNDRAQDNDAGFLSESMNNTPATTQRPAESGPFAIIGADGTVRPVTVAHDPNASMIRDLSNSGTRAVVTPDAGKGDVVVPNSGPPIDDPVLAGAKPEVKPNTPAVATTMVPPKTEPYTIKDGDTMSSIAAAWFGDGRKWDLIAKANPLVDPKKMQVGQKLNLPPKTSEREKPSPNAREYIVRPGDTLVDIARAIYGDGAKWKSIYDANKSAIGSDPDHVTVGMKLTIPSRS
jgi:nucleoid-associated protein YgaU